MPTAGLSALGTTEVITGVRQEDTRCAPETCLLPRAEPGPDAEQIVTAVCMPTRVYADSGVQTAAAAGWCGQSLRWGPSLLHGCTAVRGLLGPRFPACLLLPMSCYTNKGDVLVLGSFKRGIPTLLKSRPSYVCVTIQYRV